MALDLLDAVDDDRQLALLPDGLCEELVQAGDRPDAVEIRVGADDLHVAVAVLGAAVVRAFVRVEPAEIGPLLRVVRVAVIVVGGVEVADLGVV